jgi:hypothetical protein
MMHNPEALFGLEKEDLRTPIARHKVSLASCAGLSEKLR